MVKTILALVGLMAVGVYAQPPFPRPADQAPPATEMPDIAKIMSVPQSSFQSYQTGGLIRAGQHNLTHPDIAKRWKCGDAPTFTWGDRDDGGKGIKITNGDNDWRGFYFYHNSCDGVPFKYVWVNKGETVFVSLPHMWEGRVTRGTDQWNLGGVPRLLATWLELTLDKDGVIWGDVSLIRGCDGGALLWSFLDGNVWKGFTQWILDGAPGDAYAQKPSGNWVLKWSANTDGSINTAVRDWYMQKVGQQYVYVDDWHGNPVVSSRDGRFGTYWPGGRL